VAETDAYEFVSWTGCTPLQEAPRRAVVSNVTAAGSCVATYRLRTYRVEGIADTGGTVGSATVNPGTCAGNVCTVGHGGAVSFTAAPQTGYVLNGWSGACTPSAQNPLLASWTGVTQPGTCTASFRRSLVTVTAVPSIRVGQVAASLGGVTCDGASCMNVPSGSSVQLSATIYPYSGRFTSWTCTDGTTSVAATINLVANAPLTTCTANFTSFVPVSATSNNTNAGTASVLLGSGGGTCVSTATCYVDLNSTVTLRATPSSAQYVFRGWAASSANVTCPVANPASATTTLLASASAGCLAQFGTLDIAPD
ncbi:MAG TPA: InlB B-repeat-containing protein, partial [Polyangiales bacterium]|nr:InlB B-repeat-containing protein [Polyangiales bacterium]